MSKAKKQIVEPKELTLEEKIALKKYAIEQQINNIQTEYKSYYNQQILDNALCTLQSIQKEIGYEIDRISHLKEKNTKEIIDLPADLSSELLRKLLWMSANQFTNLHTGIRYANEFAVMQGQIQLNKKVEEIQNLEKELEQQNKENGK